MNRWKIVWLVVLGNSLSPCRMGECQEPRKLVPPKATPIPKRLENFGRTRVDDYWLRERTDPKVIAYLDAENDYTDALMAHIDENHELDTDKLRFVYTSMTTPQSSFDYDMSKRSKTLIKR